jgi:hypothetical protein
LFDFASSDPENRNPIIGVGRTARHACTQQIVYAFD